MTQGWSRREVLGGFGAAAGAGVLAAAGQAPGPRFLHGVASGDPQDDRVILWTRVTPGAAETAALKVRWQIAADAGFDRIVGEGTAEARPERDYTVKVDAAGLAPGRRYFYRFAAKDAQSPVGRTRTLPAAGAERLRFAVVSCSNWPQGYFNVYREIAADEDLDAVLHLGDYLYEYPEGVYADPQALAAGRSVKPAGELLRLADYRTRHALYKTDPDLQALHAAHPMIPVWDDHEVANDAWRGGAENHQVEEGPWDPRREAAIRAYFEWMPIREPEMAEPVRTYRRFDFGGLASLIMLDTRLIGRDRQLDYATDMIYRSFPFDISDPENPVAVADATRLAQLPPERIKRLPVPFDVSGPEPVPILDYARIRAMDPKALPEGVAFIPDAERFRQERLQLAPRTMLGAEQEQWLKGQLSDSAGAGIPWQIVGQQLLMGKLVAPNLLDVADLSQTSPERARLARQLVFLGELGLPLNLDAWDGYWAARERFFDDVRRHAANVVVLAGDSHNAWAFDLADDAGRPVAVEMAAPAVSSPGLAKYLPVPPQATAERFVANNPELVYLDAVHRGWLTLELTGEAATGRWHFVDTVLDRDYRVLDGPAYRVAAGAHRLEPA